MAELIDGNAIAAGIRQQVTAGVRALREQGTAVRLVAVVAGGSQAGEIYARSQARRCEEVGIDYHCLALPQAVAPADLENHIDRLNADPQVSGIMLNLPLPAGIDEHRMQYRIDPYKDVEGVNPANIGFVFYGRPIIAPCTALSVLEILAHTRRSISGQHVVIVGQGAIVGRPVTLFLLQEQATVTACHKFTRDLKAQTTQADVLIVAVGKPGLITGDMVKPGAVVIDVGINRVTGPHGEVRTVGDVDFDSVHPVAAQLTPVPGGIGPVTVAILLRNTLEAARALHAAPTPDRAPRTASF